MFSTDQYELLDFGAFHGVGRKLERFSEYVISRPSPPADRAKPKRPELWSQANDEFLLTGKKENDKGRWKQRNPLSSTWQINNEYFSLNLRPTPFGHLGVFAEQQKNWDWIYRQTKKSGRPIKVLNLFAYTGGSSLAAAAAGAEVVHIDSAKNVVSWARENAELSGFQDKPIRWIVEDCSLFVKRELKRRKQYDAIILDPPSFGHGPKNEIWKIEKDLIGLLRDCKNLLSDRPEYFLLSCHSPGLGAAELHATVCDAVFGTCSVQVQAADMNLKTSDGRQLNSGHCVRWSASRPVIEPLS